MWMLKRGWGRRSVGRWVKTDKSEWPHTQNNNFYIHTFSIVYFLRSTFYKLWNLLQTSYSGCLWKCGRDFTQTEQAHWSHTLAQTLFAENDQDDNDDDDDKIN